jgi:hypothetical protein
MNACRQLLLCLFGFAAGCATSQTSASRSTGPSPWVGAFRQSQMAAAAVMGPATPQRTAAYGNITVTPVESDSTGRVRVELSINAPVAPGTQLGWALFPSPCGAATPTMTGANEFPTIEISNSGSGSIRTVMSLRLEPRGTYHANVYWSSQVTDVSNVMMCANLARGR